VQNTSLLPLLKKPPAPAPAQEVVTGPEVKKAPIRTGADVTAPAASVAKLPLPDAKAIVSAHHPVAPSTRYDTKSANPHIPDKMDVPPLSIVMIVVMASPATPPGTLEDAPNVSVHVKLMAAADAAGQSRLTYFFAN